MTTLTEIWPFFGLTLRTPRLELRVIRDEDIPRYADAALSGIHPPDEMPFTVPWTRAPAAELRVETARWVWQSRIGTGPARWIIPFGVWNADGDFLGAQDLMATNFANLRTVSSGSWLKQSVQGQGLGSEMRAAVLGYAFDFLGAGFALSEANTDNTRSLGVSHSLGYRDNGVGLSSWKDGEVQAKQQLRLAAADFRRPGWTVGVSGHAAVARFLDL
ncbi:MAG: GNAT family N-acetyltransferase [Actinomycetales bacterium]